MEENPNLITESKNGVVSVRQRPGIGSHIAKFALWGGGEVLGVLIILLVLNYFNVFSLSKIFPNQLGFLPQIGKEKVVQKTNSNIGNKILPTSTDAKESILPINPAQNFVASVVVYYELHNIIYHKLSNDGLQFSVDVPELLTKNVALNVTKETLVRRYQASELPPLTIEASSLIDGERIALSLSYKVKEKSWTVRSIFANQPLLRNPTPTVVVSPTQ